MYRWVSPKSFFEVAGERTTPHALRTNDIHIAVWALSGNRNAAACPAPAPRGVAGRARGGPRPRGVKKLRLSPENARFDAV